jgi:hypothetical protein
MNTSAPSAFSVCFCLYSPRLLPQTIFLSPSSHNKSPKLEELSLQSFIPNIFSFIKGLNHFGLLPSSQHHSLKVSWHLATFIDSYLKPCSTSHHITSHHIINLQQACESPTSAKCLQLWPRSLHGKPPSLSHSSFTDICQKPKKKPPSLPPNSSELLDRGERHCWRMDTQGTAWWGWVSGHRHHHFWALVITWCGRTEHLCMRPTIVRHIPFNSHAGGFARSSGQT